MNSYIRILGTVLVAVALTTGLPLLSATQSAHAQIPGPLDLDLSCFGVGNCSTFQNCSANNGVLNAENSPGVLTTTSSASCPLSNSPLP